LIPIEPNPNTKNPNATNRSPKPYLNAADGLCLESHIFEMVEANAIIKNEFRIENHETFISDTSAENSLLSIQITAPQISAKHTNKITLDKAIFFQVALANLTKTYEIISNGTTVSNVFTILKISNPLPVSSLSI